MANPYSYQLRHDPQGRIIEKTETVAGRAVTWTYAYDKEGRLTGAHLDGRTVCDINYDREGCRVSDYFPHLDTHYRNYAYSGMDNRLQQAGNNGYTHDENGFRSIWNSGGKYTLYEYAPDYRLLKAEKRETGDLFEFSHDEEGRREAKYCNGELVEAYRWLDFLRLKGFHDGQSAYRFAYRDGERTPHAMEREDGAVASLYYDQVGSLRVVADAGGNVIKEVLYDPFGGIMEDSDPGLRIPIGFAGGLHDRDLGFVRFGWRDYDTFTSRWTAPDPLGDAGGDPDWYGYCLDDPVNLADPSGLMGCKPEEPEKPEGPYQTELYFQNSWQWQASPGACEKCQALDGRMFYGDLSGVPERPHPNCKCQVVECLYGSDFSEWEEYDREIKYEMPTPVFAGSATTLVWTRITTIKLKRNRVTFKLCGERKEIIQRINTEYDSRKIEDRRSAKATCISQTHADRCDSWWCANPWDPYDVRRGGFTPGP